MALVPKIKNPHKLSEYWPISLLGCLYKIISKLLVTKLKRALESLISCNQSTFVPNRNILDRAVVINEVVDYATKKEKKKKKKCLILKVDFERAYDSVNWEILDYKMGRFGFCVKWRAWIRECIFSRKYSVLQNGSPMEEIVVQGDPMASFLFLLVAKGLNSLMNKAVSLGKISGSKIGNEGPEISILQYAHDTLVVGEASWDNLWAMKSVFRCF